MTLGGEGVVWLDGATLRRVPAFKVQAVDTLGAGDVFHGALAAGAGRGRPWAEALAVRLGCGGGEVQPPERPRLVPDRQEVAALLGTRA